MNRFGMREAAWPRSLAAMLRRRSFAGLAMLCLALAAKAGAQPGSLDSSFDPGDGVDQSVFAVAVQPADGKIIIAGDFITVANVPRNGIARLNPQGALDASFDPGSGADDLVNAVALQGGRLIIAGYFTEVNGTNQGRVARLDGNGALDATFNPGSGADGPVLALAVQSDGKVLLGGEFTSINGTARGGIARLNSNGSLDQDFDPGTGVGAGFFPSVRCLALHTNGSLLIGGVFGSLNGIKRTNLARLDANGAVDGGFSPAVSLLGAGVLAGVNSLAVQGDGAILVAGDFTAVNGVARTNLARLKAGGELDPGFNPGGGTDSAVNAVALQDNGRVVIGGAFLRVNGVARNYLARLDAVGNLDAGFTPGAGPDDSVYAAAVQADGRILIGGVFTGYNGTPRRGIARLVGDAVAPQLFFPVRTGSTFQVSLGTLSGSSYVLEFKDAPTNGAWTSVLPGILGDGTIKTLTDPAATGPQRLYRVRVD